MSIEARALKWALGGDTGVSSEAICAHMTGNDQSDPWSYPSDPADLGRCLRLLEQFPEWQPRIAEMAAYGSGWSGLIKNWIEIVHSMETETGIHWEKGTRAPKTWKMMQLAVADGYRNDPNFECTFTDDGCLRSARRKRS